MKARKVISHVKRAIEWEVGTIYQSKQGDFIFVITYLEASPYNAFILKNDHGSAEGMTRMPNPTCDDKGYFYFEGELLISNE